MDAPLDLIWDVAVKTAMVLALLYGVLWLFRRYYGKAGVVRRGPSILVVQSAQLGPGRSLHLIGVGGRVLLVGSTSQQVSLLAELDGAEIGAGGEEQEPAYGFDRYLQQAIGVAGRLSSRIHGGRRGGSDGGENGIGVSQ
ncbi:MAG: flagellar biosynthetic protein FliO [Sphingomonadaceae bacterium]